MTSTELNIIRSDIVSIVVIGLVSKKVLNILIPNAGASERGFEVLHPNNGEQKPEKSNEKGDVN
jgi:hypothetical protein